MKKLMEINITLELINYGKSELPLQTIYGKHKKSLGFFNILWETEIHANQKGMWQLNSNITGKVWENKKHSQIMFF